MTAREVQDLVRHMEWADALVWDAVLAVRESRDDGFLRERMHHIHEVQWAYLQIWRGEAVSVGDLATFDGMQPIREWGRRLHRELRLHLESIIDDALREPVRVPWSEQLVKSYGKAEQGSLAETILQVVSHSTYHRGQVNTRIRELGGEPPLVDFIVWIWSGRPAANWGDAPASPLAPEGARSARGR